MREKPWFRSSNKHWYIQIGGVQHKLCPGPSRDDRESREQAYREWHTLASRVEQKEPVRASGSVTVAWLANAFLEHTQLHCEKETYHARRSFLKRFTKAQVSTPHGGKSTVGNLPAAGLKKWVLQRWIDQNTQWSGPSRRMAINVVITCMNWGVGQEYITGHRLKGFKKPPEGVRPGDARYKLPVLTDAFDQPLHVVVVLDGTVPLVRHDAGGGEEDGLARVRVLAQSVCAHGVNLMMVWEGR